MHRDIRAKPDDFLRAIKPFREGLVIGVECMFTWYWLADLCLDESLDFILGHALYMKAIHGGKNKDDRIDSEKIARLMRDGTFLLSYLYPREMRATRHLPDLTETPTCGMNSPLCIDGIQGNDELSPGANRSR